MGPRDLYISNLADDRCSRPTLFHIISDDEDLFDSPWYFESAMRLILIAVALTVLGATGIAAQSAPVSLDPMAAGADALIRPGDEVELEIWREEDMTGEFVVDENGDVVLPRLGIVRASDMTVGEFRAKLRSEYAKFVRTPAIEVTVLRRVGVHGEVREPDLYMIDLTLTLPDVLAKAGGITPEGNPNSITIFRGDEQIRLARSEYTRFTTAQLRSGDQIIVGRRSWFALNSLAAVSAGLALLTTIVSLLR